MSRPINALLVTDDPDLIAEWHAAERGLTDVQVLAHIANNPREALQAARERHPDIVFLTHPGSQNEFDGFVRELRQVVPTATLVGILDRQQFESGDAESTFVVAATRAGLRDFLRRPLASAEITRCVLRFTQEADHAADAPSRSGRVIPLTSNKGGVGKTTLAVNVACELARRAPGQVLLIDAALQLGLCATMLDLNPVVTLYDAVTQMDRLDPTLLRELTISHSCGLDLLAAPDNAVDAAAVREEHISRILAVARAAYDYVIVDTFPILDGIAIATFDRADEVWQVVAPTVPTVLGAERLNHLLESVGVEKERQRIVLNTSIPNHAGQLTPVDVANRLERDIDLVVPFCRAAVPACNSGQPVVLTTPRWNRFRRRVEDFADLLSSGTLARAEQQA